TAVAASNVETAGKKGGRRRRLPSGSGRRAGLKASTPRGGWGGGNSRSGPEGTQPQGAQRPGGSTLSPHGHGTGGGKLDGERDTIEVSADGSNCRYAVLAWAEIVIYRARPGDEKLHCTISQHIFRVHFLWWRHIQRWHAVDVFAFDPKGLPA